MYIKAERKHTENSRECVIHGSKIHMESGYILLTLELSSKVGKI